jgi:hypothetical protein
MKVYGHGELKQRELALRYTLSLPGVRVAILGMDEKAQPARQYMTHIILLTGKSWTSSQSPVILPLS